MALGRIKKAARFKLNRPSLQFLSLVLMHSQSKEPAITNFVIANMIRSSADANSSRLRSRGPYYTPGEESPLSNQGSNAADLVGPPNPDSDQAFHFNPFAPVLDDLLEDQISSLANWEYFQFSLH